MSPSRLRLIRNQVGSIHEMHDILSRHGVLGSMESRNSSIPQSKDIYLNDEVNIVNIIREQIETELVKAGVSIETLVSCLY